MIPFSSTNIARLISAARGQSLALRIEEELVLPTQLFRPHSADINGAELALAWTSILFEDLLSSVPEARRYVDDVVRSGKRVTFDHGAIRTVLWPMHYLPSGERAFTRFLLPLGYRLAGIYPLERLGMTGRAYAHQDAPESIPQIFLSELHPERYSEKFQQAVTRVVGESKDPLDRMHAEVLHYLGEHGALPFELALPLLGAMVAACARHHSLPSLDDYLLLAQESPEMAWIATEGNVFNHATDRVDDVEALSHEQRALGRPIKDEVEVSREGRVRQTAFKAARVERTFGHGELSVHCLVPGSFYEFISRDGAGQERLDLSFDSSNATAIFRMTDFRGAA